MMTGVPFNSRNCFGRSLPNRMPLPPATTIATFMRLAFSISDARHCRSRLDFSQRPALAFAVAAVLGFIANPSEDHFARSGLQHAGNRDVRVLPNQTPRVINHDHGPVVEIGDALVIFL